MMGVACLFKESGGFCPSQTDPAGNWAGEKMVISAPLSATGKVLFSNLPVSCAGQDAVPFGDCVLSTRDTCIGTEMCAELWNPNR